MICIGSLPAAPHGAVFAICTYRMDVGVQPRCRRTFYVQHRTFSCTFSQGDRSRGCMWLTFLLSGCPLAGVAVGFWKKKNTCACKGQRPLLHSTGGLLKVYRDLSPAVQGPKARNSIRSQTHSFSAQRRPSSLDSVVRLQSVCLSPCVSWAPGTFAPFSWPRTHQPPGPAQAPAPTSCSTHLCPLERI